MAKLSNLLSVIDFFLGKLSIWMHSVGYGLNTCIYPIFHSKIVSSQVQDDKLSHLIPIHLSEHSDL